MTKQLRASGFGHSQGRMFLTPVNGDCMNPMVRDWKTVLFFGTCIIIFGWISVVAERSVILFVKFIEVKIVANCSEMLKLECLVALYTPLASPTAH